MRRTGKEGWARKLLSPTVSNINLLPKVKNPSYSLLFCAILFLV